LLVRITWALVVVALGTLIGGFFTPESNVLLFVAIGLALGVIVLVLVSWARRAKEPGGFGFEERRPVAAGAEAEDDEELFAALERDEEFAVGGRRSSRRPRPRPGRKSSTARPEGKPKAKAKPKAKSKAKAARKTTARAPSSETKAKPTRKAKPKAKPKAKGGPATRRKAAPPPPSPEPE
jgi:hypothetical protein